ncbi:SAV_2336 N-terminal domain-related protein [Streptomyces sp. NPDC001407]|uniref:SAV_2336 N-terminal domain-related protein n=1 Tax=Streptomyces sp. NPDC001407 TaxID=3364573 RepID=UPI0036BE8176
MKAPPEPRLGQLIARLRAATWDLTPEEIADAVWLAQWVTPAARPDAGPGPEPAPVRDPDAPPATAPVTAPGTATAPAPGAPPAPTGGGPVRHAERSGPVWLYAGGPRPPRREPARDGAFPIRVPMAASLPGLLDLQRSLRPLRGYRTLAEPPRGPLDEEATADRAARTGILEPLYRRGERRAAAMQLLMDASPSMVVWELMLEELRQSCAQLGAFSDVQVRYLHRAPDGTPLIGTSATPGRTPGSAHHPRPADQFRDPTGRRLTLVISDCVGPLWQEGRAQRLLHHWSLTSPLAVVQPLPPRLWPRTALPADAGLLTRDPGSGGRLGFAPEGYGPPPPPGALPVPVLLPTREALGAWARLLSGPGRTTVRGAAGWVLPAHPALRPPAPATGPAPAAGELLRAFRASASPGALRLAVHLAAVPLALPVMQVVQRAMLPDTGPMELAEVLLSGMLWQLPGPERGPGAGHWYEFADGVRELLLQSLDQGAAALVLKHCSEYVERHFGKGARNFSALAVARLSGRTTEAEEGRHPDAGEDGGGTEPELFAEVPARVVRWYQPLPADTGGNGELGEAERLLRLWHLQADPTLLHEAREHATPYARQPAHTPEGVRGRLVLGGILRALAGTEAVRRDATARTATLTEAVALLTEAHDHAEPGSTPHTEAALELASAHHARWQDDGDTAHLLAAERALRALPADDPTGTLRLGRVLLALAQVVPDPQAYAVDAAAELRAACDLLEAEDAPEPQLCAALLDLATALRLSAAPTDETLAVLDRAGRLAADDPLRLRRLTELARARTAAEAWAGADDAYTAAVDLTGPYSPWRCALLAEWGESLLRRARLDPASEALARAESVLREAFAISSGKDPGRPRVQLLLGRALVLRFGRQGFPPDLYESVHLLEAAARHAPDARTRAESWLDLGTARLTLHDERGPVALDSVVAAFTAAVREARDAPGGASGSVLAARASHRLGEVLERMGRPVAALAAHREAAREWSELTARHADVPWAEVQATREHVSRLSEP